MDALSICTGLLGIFAVPVGIGIWIYRAVKHKGKTWIGWGTALAGLILFIVGVSLTPSRAPKEETLKVMVMPTSTPLPDGKTRTNPVPFGLPLRYGDKEVAVLNVKKQSLIGEKGEWKFPLVDYWEAEEGKIFLIVTIRFRNVGSPDKTQHYNTIDFRVVGAKGKIYDWPLFEPETGNNLGSGELFGGSAVSGDIVREVDADDSEFVLIWSADLGVSRYFSLER